jgi:prevent-host-death family protein
MTTIGVRELRRDASRWIARPRAGEVITVTDRGTPVAQLTRLPERAGYEQLLAQGHLVQSTAGPLHQVMQELARLPLAEDSLEAALSDLRDDER